MSVPARKTFSRISPAIPGSARTDERVSRTRTIGKCVKSGGRTMDTPIGNTGFGTTSATESGSTAASTCAACGQSLRGSGTNNAIEELLGRLGLSDEMIDNLRTSMANIDIEDYLDTARQYLRANSGKAKEYARE